MLLPVEFYMVVTNREFSHGLRCYDCNEPIDNGSFCFPRPADMTTSGLMVEEIVCVPCADKSHSEAG